MVGTSSSASDQPGAPLAQRVYARLADGAAHSGEQLALSQGVTRSAVWKAVGALRELGADIEALRHRGYRLRAPVTLLEAGLISSQLDPELRARLRRGEVTWSLASTNSALLDAAAPGGAGEPAAGQFDFIAAEHQSAGRGRRARQWFAPPGGAICLSLGWTYATLPRGAAALSLAVGVCVLRALRRLAPLPLRLKWPNDLIAGERKLGGILIELRAESHGPAHVVTGIGINCALGTALQRDVLRTGTEPIDLASLGLPACDRNRLAAALLEETVLGLLRFERQGLAAFAAEWAAADALAGRVVTVAHPGGEFVGHARGIDADGALCVHGHDGVRRFNSGEVSVRAVS